jgi:hypothetical protein
MNQSVKTDKKYDGLQKIRPFSDVLSDTNAKLYIPSEHLTVDEVIVLFNERVIFKHYMPKKHKHLQ